MKTEKKAIFGGTFDPVHIGHINLFHNISELTDITTLYVIPAYMSNYKRDRKTASFDDRMAMLNYAILDYSDMYPWDELNIVVSDFEGKKGGVSYTSETIRELFPVLQDNGKVNFICGDDLLAGLGGWHDFEYLKEHVRFWCFTRDIQNAHETHGAEVIFIESPVTVASSTAVREGDLEMLTPNVREYVEDAGLYRD